MSFISPRAVLIYNPMAGFGEWDEIVRNIAIFWRQHGWDVQLQATTHGGHASELARAAVESGAGLVLAAGGDGTLNEVANGLAGSDTVLALLPVGTANSFAKELGLPRPSRFHLERLTKTSQKLMRGRVQRVDLGRCADGRHWLLWAGTGVDGFIVEQIEPRSTLFKRFGPAGYLFKALLTLPEFPGMHATITVDERTIEGDFVLITATNCRLFAGGELTLNKQGVLDDGVIEVWCFRGEEWPEIMRYTVEVGLHTHTRNPNIEILAGRAVSIITEPSMPYHVDGEPAGNTPLDFTVEPGALRLLVPDTAPRDLFRAAGESFAAPGPAASAR
jgi:YegS/Rv2252/BmrU family lipid kinase